MVNTELVTKMIKDPSTRLRYHKEYLTDISGKSIAYICGSNGKIAVPLALAGANITIFDISSENKKYAVELADCAKVSLTYEVGVFGRLLRCKPQPIQQLL